MALHDPKRQCHRASKKGGSSIKPSFIKSITNLMREHDDIVTLTSDMGFSVFEDIQKEFPKRFINTGVTEQASTSIAAGLALSGYKVYFYAQAAFATMRCFEQVRLDVGYNNLNVKIIGCNAGFSLNQLGVSHFATEDVALMRLIPGMKVFSPGDSYEMEWAMNKMYDLEGPSYLRFSKVGTVEFHNKKITEKKLKMFDIKPDGDIAIFATGGILEIASEVVSRLRDYKINASLISVPVISPLDKKFLLKKIINKKAIFTVEEHYKLGGLSSAIKDALNDEGKLMKVHTFGIDDKFTNVTGSIPYLLSISGLSPIKITKQIVKSIA